jgi:hypothetical protein
VKLLEVANEKFRKQISTILIEISECLNLDHNLKVLPKLVNAKNATCAILRAAKKNDFMLLKSDGCTEIEALK